MGDIKTITFDGVNCYLIPSDLLASGDGFILIDTGYAKSRAAVEAALFEAGVRPGNLKFILITHGDFDHTGNAAYLREKYGAKIAMHRADAAVPEQGDMLLGRRAGERVFMRFMMKVMVVVFMGGAKFERFAPDVCLEDGDDLSGVGLDARVLHVPGHSRGSVAFLTSGGDLFCGDLLENTKVPKLNSLIDHMPEALASVEKIRALPVRTVYPGHGSPFTMQAFLDGYR